MMMKLVRCLWITLVLAGFISIGAVNGYAQNANQGANEKMDAPQGPPPDGHKRPGGFEKDDVDKNGKVTREEFSGPADMFDRLDADGDGVITREEARPPRDGHGPPPRKETQAQ